MSQFLEQSVCLILLIYYRYRAFGTYVKGPLLFLLSEIFQVSRVGKTGKCSQIKKN